MVTLRTATLLIACAALVSGAVRLALPDDNGDGRAAGETMTLRRHADSAVIVPASWRMIDRGHDYGIWGDASRTHTVTIGTTPASTQPLESVVEASAAALETALPGTDVFDQQAGRASGTIRMRVDTGGGTLHVRQLWLRSSATRTDRVATWSSADGTWPAPPTPAFGAFTAAWSPAGT